ncbi:MAG: hypothetical protein COC03_05785 [Robiginitomaculum sp.]|nr:MAG: hypothetical protein COC03_05785 [Robiginitomaculum sp.]
MQNSVANIFNAFWRSITGVLIAFVLMLSTSLFASASSLSQPTHISKTFVISLNHMGNHEAMQMADTLIFCDENDTPCEDNNCDIPCMSFSASHVVLTSVSGGLYSQSSAINIYDYSLKDGIFGLLNKPPPRV